MCAAPCAAITAPVRNREQVVVLKPAGSAGGGAGEDRLRWLSFHGGRLLGYAVLGGVAAYAMEQVAWFSDQTSALHPLWVALHLAALAWGLMLLFQARQPAWLERGGRGLWQKAQAWMRVPAGTWLAGCLWAFLPCGLLYSAVLVAALGGGVLQGSLAMLAFGVASGFWLVLAPWVWLRVQVFSRWREAWGLRIAGAMLAGISLWALWLDFVHTPSQWCR